jgi:serine/threonine-protein kinase
VIGHKVNNYEIKRLLGEGGMGAVYLAEHPILNRKAAVKILKPEFAANRDLVQRFLNEARAANAIHHPYIIDIIDVGLLPEGVPYMMMEFLAGESLAARIRRVRRLSENEAVRHARQTASALAAAHAVGIVHRDLKPDNLYVVVDARSPTQEQIKVLDFGVAKLRPEFAPGTPRTSAGALMGTPAYMSPEQCRGKTTEIDHRSDIYALGIILYEMLCGQPPFLGEYFGDLFLQHMTVAPRPPRLLCPEVSPDLETVVLQALEKDPRDRIQTMDGFGALLAGETGAPTLIGAQPVTRTLVLKDKAMSGRELSLVASARGDATPSPALTTLSSNLGEMQTSSDETPTVYRGRRIVLVGVSAFAICAAAVGIGFKYRKGSVPDGARPASQAAVPLLPIEVPAEPRPARPAVEPEIPKVPELTVGDGVDRHVVGAAGEGGPPVARNSVAGSRERAKKRASGRSRIRPERQEARGSSPRLPQPPTISAPPPPASAGAAPKTIKREKF